MENKKQTAVEWLVEQVFFSELREVYKQYIDQAKEMEKDQMEELKDFEKWKEWKNEPQ
jgi:hypothetical protein